MNWQGIIPAARKIFTSNATPILLVAGTVSLAGTVTMAVKAGPKIKEEVELIKLERTKGYEPKEIVRTHAKELAPYISPILLGSGITLGCFYGASHIQGKQNAALAAAASISERALVSYQDKVIEKFGEEEHGKLLESVADDILQKDTPYQGQWDGAFTDSLEGSGDTLCYDRVTGRYFYSSSEKIRQAESTIVKRCIDELYVPINDFYEELGLEDVSVIGEALGWDATKVKPDIRFSSTLDPDGKIPVLVLNYHVCVIRKGALSSLY